MMKTALLASIFILFSVPAMAGEHPGYYGWRYDYDNRNPNYRHYKLPYDDYDGLEHTQRWWNGRWWAYGVGPCWRDTPYGYMWTCE